MEERTFGWRQLLGAVNLKDFADIVVGELGMIGNSLRRAFEALPRPPFGPLISLGFLLLAALRSFLLILVVVVFGTGILVITAARGVVRAVRRKPDAGS